MNQERFRHETILDIKKDIEEGIGRRLSDREFALDFLEITPQKLYNYISAEKKQIPRWSLLVFWAEKFDIPLEVFKTEE